MNTTKVIEAIQEAVKVKGNDAAIMALTKALQDALIERAGILEALTGIENDMHLHPGDSVSLADRIADAVSRAIASDTDYHAVRAALIRATGVGSATATSQTNLELASRASAMINRLTGELQRSDESGTCARDVIKLYLDATGISMDNCMANQAAAKMREMAKLARDSDENLRANKANFATIQFIAGNLGIDTTGLDREELQGCIMSRIERLRGDKALMVEGLKKHREALDNVIRRAQ